MPPSTARNLISLFRSATRLTSERSVTTAAKKKRSSSSAAAAVSKKKDFPPSSADDVSSVKSSSSSAAATTECLDSDDDDQSAEEMLTHASSKLYDEMDLAWDDGDRHEAPIGGAMNMPWLERMSNNSTSEYRKEFTRDKKQKWVFKNTQTSRLGRMFNECAQMLGPDTTVEVFGKLGHETGLKEYNSLINICIKKARDTTDEDVSLEQIYMAYRIFKFVREKGFKIEEEMYGQFLMYLIDFGMVEAFFFFRDIIKEDNSDSLPRLAYYEMLLWVRVNNEAKIQELCRSVLADDAEDKSDFHGVNENRGGMAA